MIHQSECCAASGAYNGIHSTVFTAAARQERDGTVGGGMIAHGHFVNVIVYRASDFDSKYFVNRFHIKPFLRVLNSILSRERGKVK